MNTSKPTCKEQPFNFVYWMSESRIGLMDSSTLLHVVSFNIPYPPDYGGVIDVFYKLKSLKEQGVKVILHAFVYDRSPDESLNEYVHEVHYYRRKKGLRYLFSPLPYIVVTRQSRLLMERLEKDNFPVLFEGLHSCYYLDKLKKKDRKLVVRTHNIEHNYYRMLARSERNLLRKMYLFAESRKLKRYETILKTADEVAAISTTDHAYFKRTYGISHHISAFHQHTELNAKPGRGEYILFHGNLSVPENEQALLYLVDKVLSNVDYPVIIAGKNPGKYVLRKCNSYPNIRIISNPDGTEMQQLVANAQINLLYTYQPTGLKLKLLHSLYGGRFCLANPLMVSGSGLEDLCIIYNSPTDAIQKINEYMKLDFTNDVLAVRIDKLQEYANESNVRKLLELIT